MTPADVVLPPSLAPVPAPPAAVVAPLAAVALAVSPVLVALVTAAQQEGRASLRHCSCTTLCVEHLAVQVDPHYATHHHIIIPSNPHLALYTLTYSTSIISTHSLYVCVKSWNSCLLVLQKTPVVERHQHAKNTPSAKYKEQG